MYRYNLQSLNSLHNDIKDSFDCYFASQEHPLGLAFSWLQGVHLITVIISEKLCGSLSVCALRLR